MTNSRRRPLLLPALVLALACAPSRGAADPAPVLPDGDPSRSDSPALAQDTARIVVSGTGTVRVPSDRASIRLAVETEATTAAAASSANAETAQAILDAVRPRLGGDDRLETSGYQVTPMYERDPETRGTQVTGYRVQNSVLVTLTDLDDVGPVLDAALAAGANRVDDLSFFASDLGSAREEALRIAVEQARSQALATAGALGVPLGAILDVRTNTSTPGGLQPMMLQVAEGRSAGTPIEAGSNVVNANVTITWALGGRGPLSGAVDFRTDPDHARPELRGRTYAVPFDAVWEASLAAVADLRRWELTDSDDQAGWIEVHAEGWPFRSPADLRIEVSLDHNGQTRVDLESTPSDGKPRVAPARRRVIRFFRALDAAVDPEGRHTLDARTPDGEGTP